MFSKVSVLIPTRRRIMNLQTVLKSFARTSHEYNVELVFRIDEDDDESFTFLSAFQHTVIRGPRHQGYKSMPLFFNELAQAAKGDVLMCGNDDMVFKSMFWANAILRVANRFPDGLFNIGVRTLNEDHYPFSIVSNKVVRTLGFLWDPRIFWGDIYLRDIMAALERTVKLPEVEILHDWMGHRPDQVFLESDKDITGKDPTYWSGTHLRAVNEAVEKLQKLKEVCLT